MLFRSHPALWAGDYHREGLRWLECHQESKCVYAFERRGGGERLAAVFNFSGREQTFRLELPGAKGLRVLLDSAAAYRESGGGAWLPLPPEGAELRLEPYGGIYCLAQ